MNVLKAVLLNFGTYERLRLARPKAGAIGQLALRR